MLQNLKHFYKQKMFIKFWYIFNFLIFNTLLFYFFCLWFSDNSSIWVIPEVSGASPPPSVKSFGGFRFRFQTTLLIPLEAICLNMLPHTHTKTYGNIWTQKKMSNWLIIHFYKTSSRRWNTPALSDCFCLSVWGW